MEHPKFSSEAQAILDSARTEAQVRPHVRNPEHITTDHLFLALVKDRGLAGRVLSVVGLNLEESREIIEKQLSSRPAAQYELRQSPRLKMVIGYSEEFARDYGRPEIGPEHLVLGLVGDEIVGEYFSANLLRDKKISYLEIQDVLRFKFGR